MGLFQKVMTHKCAKMRILKMGGGGGGTTIQVSILHVLLHILSISVNFEMQKE